MAAGFLALRAPPTRLLSYVVALCAASLKYYPVTLMILSVRERIMTFLAVNAAALCVIALFIVVYFPELAREFLSSPLGLTIVLL